MTPQETADFFYGLLLEDFHYGHQRAQVNRAYKQVCEKLNAPVTGMGEHPSEIPVVDETVIENLLFNAIGREIYVVTISGERVAGGAMSAAKACLDEMKPYLRLPEPQVECRHEPFEGRCIHCNARFVLGHVIVAKPEPVSVDLAAGAKAICDFLPFSWIDEEKIVPSELTLPLDEERSDARVLAKACAEAWGLKWK